MASVLPPPSPSTYFRAESEAMNTIPDPRTPSPHSEKSRHGSTDSAHHPDLSNEVAMLSTKLVNAINYQTSLDDTLQATRHELEAAREQLARLEAAAKEHADMIAQGLLIRKANHDIAVNRLAHNLENEKQKTAVAEKERKRMESELENLTTALFEEANAMVASARKETEASEKRNEQLRNQLNDTELLLASQQEQLQDLKAVMQEMSSERGENDAHMSTAPSTPGAAAPDKLSRTFEELNMTPNTPGMDEVPADHPLRFSHLIRPVLRTDLSAYEDFAELLRLAKSTGPSSRVASGNYSGLNVMGLSSFKNSSQPNISQPTASSPATPVTPSNGNASPRVPPADLPPLKDNRFYKRALAEDIEPTLRLDAAPGLSWLARRTVINSMTTGGLVVEPHPPIHPFRGPIYSCALCGESRKADIYKRKHRFRTSESDDAQRYPLCDYCLGRVRATCDYIGFLRMVWAGHWRAETEEEVKSGWEESVRLRERMFWARLGGGVVPAFLQVKDSPSSPIKGQKSVERASEDTETGQEPGREKEVAADPFKSEGGLKRVSIGKTVISNPELGLTADEERKIEEEAAQQLQDDMRRSLEIKPQVSQAVPPTEPQATEGAPRGREKEGRRLSLTIPGSFV
ncbi:hypothetical protein W97_05603 [Coniosporium apollinis CBS 100218]|uniref:GDP/GTP exchange factor Sec2 N-terminal domain-containing protein n=1 Tax=Coniosporium apollinis (strain CBS 100218) TaxID=1168221 RepID=R7YWA0_CONA1|nr:uncharacterized protein W97_05603 [Coniosporium apollinis CBS 100218]EON66210.1 hypothetical protein W97_05603 [Coniosporium apollinis CBS 100218]